jgi:hypothetical protein
MSQTRKPRRLLACAALSAGVLLGSGAASAEAPRPAPERAPFAALLDAALELTRSLGVKTEVALQPKRRMGNTKGPAYTDACASVMVAGATPARPARGQARTRR